MLENPMEGGIYEAMKRLVEDILRLQTCWISEYSEHLLKERLCDGVLTEVVCDVSVE